MPKFPIFLIGVVTLLLTAVATPVLADDKAPVTRSAEDCAREHQTCRADCETKHVDDEAKKAACLSVCSARYAACDANAAYQKARPWLEEKARQTKKFLEDLMKDLPGTGEGGATPAPETPPTPKTPKSI